jgi:molecular chaperone HscB
MSFDFSRDHFELFDLPRNYRIDTAALESAFRTLQSHYHPDRVASEGDAERRRALQISTHLNEAFQTLKSPLSRARYLLSLADYHTLEDSNTAMPQDFLMQQMEWRESIADAKAARDVGALQSLAHDLQAD